MKKTLLFLLVCLTCNIMTGQGSLVMNPLDGTDNIVRFESTSGFHISCSQQGGDVHFALTNMNMFKDVFVATDLTVKDFEMSVDITRIQTTNTCIGMIMLLILSRASATF